MRCAMEESCLRAGFGIDSPDGMLGQEENQEKDLPRQQSVFLNHKCNNGDEKSKGKIKSKSVANFKVCAPLYGGSQTGVWLGGRWRIVRRLSRARLFGYCADQLYLPESGDQ